MSKEVRIMEQPGSPEQVGMVLKQSETVPEHLKTTRTGLKTDLKGIVTA